MWLSSRLKPAPAAADAEQGVTSIAGGEAGVVTGGEVRSLPIYSPGGYFWKPACGDTVLLLRGGPGGAEHFLAGKRQETVTLDPGEVAVCSSGGAKIVLHSDGSIELSGAVQITGSLSVNGKTCNAGATLASST